MVSQLELGGLILNPVSRLGPKYRFPDVSPGGILGANLRGGKYVWICTFMLSCGISWGKVPHGTLPHGCGKL